VNAPSNKLLLASRSPDTFPSHGITPGGASPCVSSSGGASGTGIVWLLAWDVQHHQIINLHAYNATNLSDELGQWSAGSWNNIDGGAFISPMIIQGKVMLKPTKSTSSRVRRDMNQI
jgi:hypothetical protein